MRVLLADVVPVFQFEICLMKIASFNINGIKARTPALIDWLKDSRPDVALLQEIKSIDEAFPKEPFEENYLPVITKEWNINGKLIYNRQNFLKVIN